ncbi:YjjG family noncanonical pyrimidine nucleotidase [Paenibacillus rigui]|uniref:Noncanonical pyrimidine nucleotidase, YjjG family n=1 Tax=Paenibacillus rigui TaxID=554312 RepID=A0A229UW04_9BACL|nr:YjjG family noncanonical pyrimidine nucleotidase [Paenibacillus rigui]OXM87736.1 noncanonical pyrimidine nucleotidase, YjjG family [Paenibacillus rigui]
MSYEVILFDADDTLFDYSAAEAFALERAFGNIPLECSPELIESYRTINQQLWNEFELGTVTLNLLRSERFKRLFERHQLKVDIHPEQFSETYLQHLAASAFLIDGAVELCEYLKSDGYRLAVITNGIKEVQLGRIGLSALSEAFELIVVSEDAGVQKPQAAIFEYTMERLGFVEKNKVLMVGDSLTSDIRGGINYGIDTCWFNPKDKRNISEIQPTYEIAQLSELKAILQSKRSGSGV